MGHSIPPLTLLAPFYPRAGSWSSASPAAVTVPASCNGARRQASLEAARLLFVEQPQPRGYGHALALARDFTAGGPLLHLIGDRLYVSRGDLRCARQVLEQPRAESCSVSAVRATRETPCRGRSSTPCPRVS
jgi:UTP--glucose-1-phosphate uridylyltransferase